MDPKISSLLSFIVIFSFTFNFGSGRGTVMSLNASVDGSAPAVATWYGEPTGHGTDTGACGFGSDVAVPPFSSRITAGNQAIYHYGKGCGVCYSLYCTGNPSCSGRAITVIIADECPDRCNDDPVHFDLSGFAFGLLAKPGQENQLRKAGRIQVFYQRAQCNYPNKKIEFKVHPGSNQYYLALTAEYLNGDGDIGMLEIKPAGYTQFVAMQQAFGATYKYDIQSGVRAPYSIRVTLGQSRRSIVAQNVIPAGWYPGARYTSYVNF